LTPQAAGHTDNGWFLFRCRPHRRRGGQRSHPYILIWSLRLEGWSKVHFLPSERVALFIDGANLYSASRNLGFDVDYRNLLEFFRRKAHVIRAYYYSAVLETEEYSPLKPLTDWLAYNGYTLVTKPAKEFTDATGRRRVKGNMDIELAIDMLELADKIDHAVLFSGDSDFRRLVEAVQRRGVRVSVVSSIRTAPPMVADELRRQADQFLELAEIAPEFTRRQMEPRPSRGPARLTPAEPYSDPQDGT
jgi:uncharacterized LabA/DUF88 family protein